MKRNYKNAIVFTLSLVILVSISESNVTSQTCPASQTTIYPNMGGNLSPITGESEDRLMVDRIYYCNFGPYENGPWRDQFASQNPAWVDNNLLCDVEGWPNEPSTLYCLDRKPGVPMGNLKHGKCLLRFTGKNGAVTITHNLWGVDEGFKNFTFISRVGNTYVYSFDIWTEAECDQFYSNNPSAGWLPMRFNFNGPVRDVSIIPTHIGDGNNPTPTGWTLDSHPDYDPVYYDLYKNLKTFRFMQWGFTNINDVQHWEDRTPPTACQSGINIPPRIQRYGVAYEHMIGVCNSFRKNMWVCVPVLADDNYVRQMATLIRDNLDKDLVVYVELGNELWNGMQGFWSAGMQWVNCHKELSNGDPNHLRGGGTTGLTYDGGSAGTLFPNYSMYGEVGPVETVDGLYAYTAERRSTALRLKQISDIFASVWGQSEINNRVRILLADWYAGPQKGEGWSVGLGLDYIDKVFGSPKKYFYGIAVAPYFAFEGGGTMENPTYISRNDVLDGFQDNIDEMFSPMGPYDGGVGNFLTGFLGKAKYYGLNMLAYEGGPDFGWVDGDEGALFTERQEAHRDARLKDICVEYWTNWFKFGNDGLFCQYETGSSSEYRGMYSWMENEKDITAPVYQAINQVATTVTPEIGGIAGIHSLPTVDGASAIFDAREISGYGLCDFHPCTYDWQNNRMIVDYNTTFPCNCYNNGTGDETTHPGKNDDSWLISANKNATYIVSVERSGVSNPNFDVLIDGELIHNNITMSYSSTNQSYNTSATNFELNLNYGIHLMRFIYNGENSNLFNIKVTLKPNTEVPPAQPSIITGRQQICKGGEDNLSYTVVLDPSACEYEWTLPTGATLVSGFGTSAIVVNFGAGFTGGNISVVAKNDAGESISPMVSLTSTNCGFSISKRPACVNEPVVFTDETAEATAWNWNFGFGASTATSTVKGPHTISYSSVGLRPITLSASNADGTKSYTNYLLVNNTIAGTLNALDNNLNAGESTSINLLNYSGAVTGWQTSIDGISGWSDVSGALNDVLSTGALQQSVYYRARVQSDGCPEKTTPSILLNVNTIFNSGNISNNQTICAGTSPTTLLLQNNTIGTTVARWQYSSESSGWTDIPTATGNTYSPAALTVTTNYRAMVTNGSTELPSMHATITVVQAPVAGTVQTNSLEICANASATLTLSGYNGSIQWQSSANGVNGWTNINGATTSTYTTAALTSTAYYKTVVSGTNCPSFNSNIVTINIVNSATAGTVSAITSSVCINSNTTLTLSNYSGNIQWKSSLDNLNFTNVTGGSGSTTANYTTANISSSIYYMATVSSGNCTPANSNVIHISVNPASKGGQISGTDTVNLGEQAALILIGHNGNVIKWQYSVSPFTQWRDTIITRSDFLSHPLNQTSRFRIIVKNGNCNSDTSLYWQVNVKPNIAGNITGGTTVCYGSSGIQLHLQNYNGIIRMWRYAEAPLYNVIDLANNSNSYTTGSMYKTTIFWAVIQGMNGDMISIPDTIVVNNLSDAVNINGINIVNVGNTSTLSLTGFTGKITKWQSSVQNGVWTDIALSANQSTIISNPLTQKTSYRSIVQNGNCPPDTSALFEVIVSTGGTGVLISNTNQVCEGSNLVNINLIGCNGSVSSWQYASSATGPWQSVASVDTFYNLININTSTYVKAMVILLGGKVAFTDSIRINVDQNSDAGKITPQNSTICSGSDGGLLTLSSNTGSPQDWLISNDSVNYFSAGIHTTFINAGVINNTRWYKAIVKNGVCTTDTSSVSKILVQTIPNLDFIVENDTICSGNTANIGISNADVKIIGVTFSAQGSDLQASYENNRWGANITNATNKVYTIAIRYGNNCLLESGKTISVTTIPKSVPIIIGQNAVCPGDSALLYMVKYQSGHTYTWSVDQGNIISTNDNEIKVEWDKDTIGKVTVTDTYQQGCISSESMNVTISDVTAPEIVCSEGVKISIPIDSVRNNQYIYLNQTKDLEPLMIQDNCGVSSLLNNYNQTNILQGTSIPFQITDSREYEQTIKWTLTDNNGLSSSCQTTIKIELKIEIEPFSAFSPNGDGINEYWVIKNITKYPDAIVQVYNRWGILVYESKEEYNSNQWNGSVNNHGKVLPVDSYHYVISLENKILLKGIVTLIE